MPAVPSPYHRLNPLTKAVIATIGSLAAIIVGGYLVGLLVIAVALISAAVAGVFVRLVRVTVAVTLALAISIVLVSALTRAGTTVLFVIGPFEVTAEGVEFAAQTLVKVFALSLSIGLFTLTTTPDALVADLQRRGVSQRFAFVALATTEAIPAMVRRGAVIAEAQRARGLDSEGGILARVRGLLPLVGPVLISAITDVEQRSLALEARAFSRPGRRHQLWAMSDTAPERLIRWALAGAFVVAVGLRIAGRI